VKKTIFFIERSNDLRFFGSLINFFLKKKIKIELLYFLGNTDKSNSKYYLNPKNLKTQLTRHTKIKKFTDIKDIQNYLITNKDKISFIFSLVFLSKKRFYITSKFLNAVDKKWCVINHGLDNYTQFKDEDTNLNYKCNFFCDSKYFYKKGLEWSDKFAKKKNILNSSNVKIYFVGSSMFTKEIFLKKFSVRKKLIYLPFPFLRKRYNSDFSFQAAFAGKFINYYSFLKKYHNKNFLNSILEQCKHFILNNLEIMKNIKKIKNYYYFENELQVIKSIRKFCDKNNLEFIVKPRLKFAFCSYTGAMADRVIIDNESSQFPTMFQKEISNAEIVIGSLSSAIYETAMFKVPYINIEIPNIAFKSKSDHSFYNYKKNSNYNFKGVIYNNKIKHLIKTLEFKKLSDFRLDKKRSQKYLQKFCGINKKDFGERVYEVLKKKL
tara:strand:- start:5556 stop:6863 length:1308 start_codon:yes stop_codon:yes gene_type:complete